MNVNVYFSILLIASFNNCHCLLTIENDLNTYNKYIISVDKKWIIQSYIPNFLNNQLSGQSLIFKFGFNSLAYHLYMINLVILLFIQNNYLLMVAV